MQHRQARPRGPISEAIARSRGVILTVAGFSGVVNILGLTGSFYMLQVYDRVLASRSVATLVAISLLALALFALQGLLEVVRSQVLSRVGVHIERDLLKSVHALVYRLPLTGRNAVEGTQPVRDMEAIRTFMASQAPIAFLDLPWMPIYLLLIFLLNPWLGVLALFGMAVLVTLALMTESQLREPTGAATSAGARRQQIAETTRRNFEVLRAMGFADRAASRFYRASGALFDASQRAADVSSTLGSISRVFRVMLQSAILGLGAYLVLRNEMSAGAIIASSILSGRSLAPVEMAIANWKVFVAARQARARLEELVRLMGEDATPIDLPIAEKSVQVDGLTIAPPGSRNPVVRNARLLLNAGDGLAVMGPSGAGKSTLARGLVGAWPALAGTVRLDGAPLDQWPIARIGQLIGYLPQEVELFDGTIAENIARLDPDAEDLAVVAAAKVANVHDMILRLPGGYSTALGEGGQNLSVGQRQRIGLARALYGDPFLVVLDEPNAHLDQEGEAALAVAIAAIRARKGIVVAVSHRSSILGGMNKIAIVGDGEIKAFGPRDEILKSLAEVTQAGKARAGGQQRPQGGQPSTVRPFPAPMQTGATMTGRMAGAGPRPATPQPAPAPQIVDEGDRSVTGTAINRDKP